MTCNRIAEEDAVCRFLPATSGDYANVQSRLDWDSLTPLPLGAKNTMSHTILVKDALVISADQAPFFGWVSVRDDRISEVGPQRPSESNGYSCVIDARGGPLIPGLINAHAHSQSTLTRGSAEGLPLDKWLPIIFREMRRLTDEQAYCAALLTYGEALLSGTTCIIDMCQVPRAAARAANLLGIRAILAPYVADSLDYCPTLEESETLIKENNGKLNRVQFWVGLAGLNTSTLAQVEHAVALARQYGVGFHTHCSETKTEIERSRQETGRTPTARLHALNALNAKTLLAHCVWLSEEDRDLIASHGVHIAHCPQSNLKLGSGLAPIRDFLARGINVTLGSDGAKANNRLDGFDAMKFASLLQKGWLHDPAVLTSREVFAMATSNCAPLLGLNVGMIAPGAKADLVLLRADALNLQPVLPETVLANLVHAARGGDVDTVIVDGRIVVENGRLIALDQSELAAHARQTAKELLAG
jgi:5-methylthioadenosine/S-adenosylhomocysteine deaminase